MFSVIHQEKTVPGSEHLGCKAFGSAGQKLGRNTEAFGVLMDLCFIMQRVAKCASWVIAAVLGTNISVCIGRGLQRLGTCGHHSAICFLTCVTCLPFDDMGMYEVVKLRH